MKFNHIKIHEIPTASENIRVIKDENNDCFYIQKYNIFDNIFIKNNRIQRYTGNPVITGKITEIEDTELKNLYIKYFNDKRRSNLFYERRLYHSEFYKPIIIKRLFSVRLIKNHKPLIIKDKFSIDEDFELTGWDCMEFYYDSAIHGRNICFEDEKMSCIFALYIVARQINKKSFEEISVLNDLDFHGLNLSLSNFDNEIFKTEGIKYHIESPDFYGYSDTDYIINEFSFDKNKIHNDLLKKFLISEWKFQVTHEY